MRAIWDRIENWLGVNASKVLEGLQPGATQEEIQQVEDFFNVQLPEDVQESYRIHNGQYQGAYSLFPHVEFLSLNAMIERWKIWWSVGNEGFEYREWDIDKGVWRGWCHPKWIPLTYESNGTCQCLDLAPEPGGKVGQIIIIEWQEPTRAIVAPNFKTWLTEFATELEYGEYVFSENGYGLVDRADLVILEG
ncbi:MAG: SMI1/KNR4 family protein [Coleofasciculus sp. S288]|nr:SMI1/KNR4 family protein [Coleofasciculus sp. S288]